MIKTLTMHNKATTTRHNGVGFMCGPHFIVLCCCDLVVHNECKDHFPYIYIYIVATLALIWLWR
jgi:hypothetical protein